jgi:hypothetical protein
MEGFMDKLRNAMMSKNIKVESKVKKENTFRRPHLSMDKGAKFIEKKLSITAKENKELYLQNYGINLTLPH